MKITIKIMSLLKQVSCLFFITTLACSMTKPALAETMFYIGGGLGLSTVTGDNNTKVDIGLPGPDNIVIDTKNLSHDLLTESHALLGIGKLFAESYYTGLELFAHYQPSEVTDQSSVTRSDQSNLDYQIFNKVFFKSPGVTYGVNWIQSIIFTKPFFVYSILGVERSKFVWTVNTNFAASGNDFGVATLSKKANRLGINIGLGISHQVTPRMRLRIEYVYSRYENLDLSGSANITGQATDTIEVDSKINPSHQSTRLILTYLM